MKRTGTYTATYHLRVDFLALAIGAMQQGVVASFGDGDDQWEGLDLHDAGSTITVGPSFAPAMRALTVTVPIAEVPGDYWVSPLCFDFATYSETGDDLRGEAADWGVHDPVTGGLLWLYPDADDPDEYTPDPLDSAHRVD